MSHTTAADGMMSRRLSSTLACLLILAALVEFLAIWHHPHVQSQDASQITLGIVAASHAAGLVHGFAVGCTLLIAFCLFELLANRIPGFLFRGAILVYAAGLAALISAATVDGWVLERLAGGLVLETTGDPASNTRLFKLCMAWVVASTNVGIVLTSVGILIASAGLLYRGRLWMPVGLVGVVSGVGLSLAIVAGHLTMDGHGAIIAVGLQAIWFLILGGACLMT